MNNEVKLLDHGYLKVIETWGSDARIVEAARMSTNKGFEGWGPITKQVRQCRNCRIRDDEPGGQDTDICPVTQAWDAVFDNAHHHWYTRPTDIQVPGDEKLLKFLWDHKHATPFEMAGMIIEVQAPIVVFREWHRHRTQSYNEMSGRYTKLPDLYYVPSIDRLMNAKQATANKQSSVAGFSELDAIQLQNSFETMYHASRDAYEQLLSQGVAREVARLVLPVAQYSRMRASANLRNWLAFLTLRMDPAAQWEIRQYANALGDCIHEAFPRTWDLFQPSR